MTRRNGIGLWRRAGVRIGHERRERSEVDVIEERAVPQLDIAATRYDRERGQVRRALVDPDADPPVVPPDGRVLCVGDGRRVKSLGRVVARVLRRELDVVWRRGRRISVSATATATTAKR